MAPFPGLGCMTMTMMTTMMIGADSQFATRQLGNGRHAHRSVELSQS